MTALPLEGIDIFDPANLDDPNRLYRALRENSPVHRVPGTDFYLVSTWELVSEAAARVDDFSSNLTGVLVQQPDGPPLTFDMDGGGQAIHVLATADDPTHAHHRKLVLQTLGKRIRALGPTVDRLADRLWDEGLRDGRIDYATDMADKLPLALIANLVGLPESDVPQLLTWAYDSTELLGGVVTADRLGQLVTSSVELAGYLHTQFVGAKKDPQDDFMGVLARACADGDLTDDVAVLILVQLVGAGGESTAGLIANSARLLATNPGIQNWLRDNPALVDHFLDEALRLESPFRAHHRHVVADTTLGGVTLPAGSHALLLWGSANRDPARFERPDEVVLDRPSIRSHLAFGKGTHFCVGSALARMEALAAVTMLIKRSSDIALADDAAWVPSIFVRRHLSLPLQIN
ncbi:cytochrome P450 [Rhodococcus maanshanensis]|uniref:Cytochrome P450 n=1 Tax=Rhodococcus maanshanensis TaxID=183556 RepID=A0A1H7VYP7_9NOCA|nr:cytochrome P450 [Rhodococcus maanshanensis]SEM14462.1 Cytochrome P450 [Rhodococcus maanshanensis]